MFEITFVNAFYFYFLPLIGLVLLIIFFRNSSSLYKKLSLTILRFIILVTLLAALAGPAKEQLHNDHSLTIAIDASASIEPELNNKFQQTLRDLQSFDANINLLYFAKDIASEKSELKDLQGTNFEKLLSGQRGQLVLLSDGAETAGNIENIQDYSQLQINPVVYDLEASESSKVGLKKLHAPVFSSAGISETLRYVIDNSQKQKLQSKLIFKQNGKIIQELNLNVPANGSKVIELDSELLIDGINDFSIEIADYNIKEEHYITARKQARILLVADQEADNSVLNEILEKQSYTVQKIYSNQKRITQNINLDSFRAVIFNNFHHKYTPAGFEKNLNEFVMSGGGFMMIGGNQSFGLGGYKGTEYEKLLPVDMKKPEKEQQRVNVAVELVLDKSGSMKKSSKINFTKLAAEAVINALEDEDYFGVIGFDSRPFVALNISRLAGRGRAIAKQRVGLLFPNGSTNLYPAMDTARVELERAQAIRKHMIILTDGQLPDGMAMGPTYTKLAEHLKSTGVTVSTFMIGGDNSQVLEDIARSGGGKFHRTYDAASLPRLFIDDVKVNVGDRTQKESSNYQVQKNRTLEDVTKINQYPYVRGFVDTVLKPGATGELNVIDREKSPPLLAYTKRGQGRTVAFTSDATGRWTSPWVNWEGIHQYWRNVLDYLMDQESFTKQIDYNLDYFISGNELNLDINTYDIKVKTSDFTGELRFQNSEVKALGFKQIKPGLFRYTVPVASPGVAGLLLKTSDGFEHKFKINLPDLSNLEKPGTYNTAFLYKLASKSGGSVNPDLSNLPKKLSERITYRDLSFYLLIPALLLLLIEVVYRERA